MGNLPSAKEQSVEKIQTVFLSTTISREMIPQPKTRTHTGSVNGGRNHKRKINIHYKHRSELYIDSWSHRKTFLDKGPSLHLLTSIAKSSPWLTKKGFLIQSSLLSTGQVWSQTQTADKQDDIHKTTNFEKHFSPQKIISEKLQFNESQNEMADTLPLFFQITKVDQLPDIKNHQVTKSHPWAFTCRSESVMKKLRDHFLQVCFL